MVFNIKQFVRSCPQDHCLQAGRYPLSQGHRPQSQFQGHLPPVAAHCSGNLLLSAKVEGTTNVSTSKQQTAKSFAVLL